MIEVFVGDAGIRFNDIKDIEYVIKNNLTEGLLEMFFGVIEMEAEDLLFSEEELDEEDGFNFGDYGGSQEL